MKLHSMEVKHYRSIQNARLECCGRFNVLIGKNNSGKSNLLTALAAFFDGLSNGQVVALTPRIGQELDYHNRVVDEPISITMIFNLSDDERARLMHNIVSEAPQLRNAAEGLSQDLQLWVSWKSLSPQHGFGFVDSVVIRGAESESGTTLLRIGDEAAYELYTKQRSKRDLMEQSSMLDSVIDENASHWRRSFREDRSARLPFRYLLDRSLRSENYPSTQAIVRELEETFQTADSFDEFISSVASFKSDLDSQLSDLSQSQLDPTIDTFGGEQTMVPKYVSRLLDDISDIKILHLRERREPIGEEEAKKLLNLKVSRGGEDTLRSIKQTVNALLDVNIDAFQAPPNAPEREVELDVDNFLVQVNGAGMREALRVVLDFEFQQPDIMLVEEPEIHLHPALEMNMMQYLKRISQDCQIFLTTHSTNFLDTADMQKRLPGVHGQRN